MRQLFLALVLFAFPVTAQEQPETMVPFGQIDGVINGNAAILQVGTIRDARESFASIGFEEGQMLVQIMGLTVDSTGAYSYPSLRFRLLLVDGVPGPYSMVSYVETQESVFEPILAGAPAGFLAISDFSISDSGEVSFDFVAQLIRLGEDWEPLAGQPPVDMSGDVFVAIPARFRE